MNVFLIMAKYQRLLFSTNNNCYVAYISATNNPAILCHGLPELCDRLTDQHHQFHISKLRRTVGRLESQNVLDKSSAEEIQSVEFFQDALELFLKIVLRKDE